MFPQINDVTFADGPEWLKIVMPAKRSWLLFLLFTVCLFVWVAMLVGIVAAIFREGFGFLLNTMLVIWLIIWLWFGRVLWRRWQYYAASREILFANDKQLIVRRPVSILGTTDAYEMAHINPFYFSEKHQCPAFDYAYQHVYFGHNLATGDAEKLVETLNARFFSDLDDE